jgi:membrane protease YdiL (CAAX protease family)
MARHDNLRGFGMPFWQRSLVLVAAMIAVSFVFGLIWHWLFGFNLPGYVSGVVGGLTAVPLWDLLKKTKQKSSKPG